MFERKIGTMEFGGIFNATIPMFDKFGDYNEAGLAIVEKDGMYGVVNSVPEVVIPAVHERIKVLDNGVTIAYNNGIYSLFDKYGYPITNNVFIFGADAEMYAKFF